jgi:hypothetical protein
MKKLYEDIVKVMIGEAKAEMPKDIVRRAHPDEKEDEHKDKHSNDEKRLSDLRNKMQSEPWHDNHKEILTNIFAKKFPDTKVHFKKTKDNALYVTTHKPSLKNTEVDLTSNDKDTSHHFQALISGPNIERHKDGTLVTGTSFDSVRTGKYKGVIGSYIKKVTPDLAKRYGAHPATMLSSQDQSGGAWEEISKKYNWKHHSPE